jgi:hypothetical protein
LPTTTRLQVERTEASVDAEMDEGLLPYALLSASMHALPLPWRYWRVPDCAALTKFMQTPV